ncbi:phage major capsid protein [Carnobacterium maltaromaticum]|uniref:phage major capsid protein n=1 Tax=Carnobacterium maltaromaticum TaxID=2751 RepID=UPI001074606D|nr:phage major capsid protein [Carnobacterium maltaromaticum]TFJ56042.1 phage major capsid protein [Carnobacterium maltaromaticum]
MNDEYTLTDWLGNELTGCESIFIITTQAGIDYVLPRDYGAYVIEMITSDKYYELTEYKWNVVTNQDGFNFLDKLKDEKGNYILQPDPTNATKKVLFGAYPVVTLGNKFLPTVTKKAPIFLGDLKEAVILFDRGVYEVTATNTGGKSFTRNTTDVRVIDRFDVQKWDEDAVVNGEIDLTTTP